MRIDLNSDLGEGYGLWLMGDAERILDCVTSANVHRTVELFVQCVREAVDGGTWPEVRWVAAR